MDPSDAFACFIEVKWGIEPDSMKEMAKTETDLVDGASQHAALRRQIVEGAQIELPHGWPDVSGWDQCWFVVTPDYVPSTPAGIAAELPVTALRILEELLAERGAAKWDGPNWRARPASTGLRLRELVATWLSGVTPEEGRDWQVQPVSVPIGEYTVHWDYLKSGPAPERLFE